MRVKSKSEAIKYGEPNDHKQALENLKAFWKEHSDLPYTWNYYIPFHETFIRKQKLKQSNRTEMGHEYDFVVFQNKVIEDHQILMEYGFIEIDGEKHDKKNQKINDGVAEDFIHDLYPKAFFIRLNKKEVLGEFANIYMAKHLKDVLNGSL
jgi:hypothetical protein